MDLPASAGSRVSASGAPGAARGLGQGVQRLPVPAGSLPRFAPVVAPAPPGLAVCDVARTAREASLWLVDQSPLLGPGRRVAITAGSRSLAGLVTTLSQLTGVLRLRGAEPWLVPAMGSHGGATPDGQREVLAGLGVTEQTVRAPLLLAGSAAPTGRTPAGRTVFCHPAALVADAVVVLNRVKSHSAYEGAVESGILKMLAVGLGGPEGASEVHRHGAAGMEAAIVDLGRSLTGRLPLAGALATVENAAAELAALEPSGGTWRELSALDSRCLALAKSLEPALPVDDLDLLLVDWMGKDISGPGMDPKVVGRRRVWDYPEPAKPHVRRLVVFRLTPVSAGNANGVGLADFTTRRLAESIDWRRSLKNVETTTFLRRVLLPPVLDTDREAVEAALQSLGGSGDWRRVRAMRVRDTKHLDRFAVSEALLGEVEGVAGPPEPLPFGRDGNLVDLAEGSTAG